MFVFLFLNVMHDGFKMQKYAPFHPLWSIWLWLEKKVVKFRRRIFIIIRNRKAEKYSSQFENLKFYIQNITMSSCKGKIFPPLLRYLPESVTLVAVQRLKPISDLQTSIWGQRIFFEENRVSRNDRKNGKYAERYLMAYDSHLQRNKVKYMAE